MQITLLHYSAPPVVGGVESVILHHARQMAAAGHRVRILAGRGEETDPTVSFIHLPLADSRHPGIMSVKAKLDEGVLSPEFYSLVDQLRTELQAALAGTDLLIVHNAASLHKNLPLTSALKQIADLPDALRIILWHHDLAWTTPRYRTELHDGFPWDLLRCAWPGVTQVVVSELRRRELSELLHLPPAEIRVVPNGVDVAQFLKLEALTRSLINKLDLFSAAPLLLLPVRITRRKNIELALRSVAVLRENFPQAALVVTGPLGPHNPANRQYFQELSALRAELGLQGTVHFLAEIATGFLPDPVVADFYHLADALVLPSREEGFGIPILEAGLAGIPVFCADIPPLRALGGDYAAYFSPTASPDQVADLISRRMLSDSTYGLRLRVRKHYTWERIFREHIEPLLKTSELPD